MPHLAESQPGHSSDPHHPWQNSNWSQYEVLGNSHHADVGPPPAFDYDLMPSDHLNVNPLPYTDIGPMLNNGMASIANYDMAPILTYDMDLMVNNGIGLIINNNTGPMVNNYMDSMANYDKDLMANRDTVPMLNTNGAQLDAVLPPVNIPAPPDGAAPTANLGRFRCRTRGCSGTFKRPSERNRHEKEHEAPPYRCCFVDCPRTFHRPDKLRDHLKQGHKGANPFLP
jgi:hypothetical protein